MEARGGLPHAFTPACTAGARCTTAHAAAVPPLAGMHDRDGSGTISFDEFQARGSLLSSRLLLLSGPGVLSCAGPARKGALPGRLCAARCSVASPLRVGWGQGSQQSAPVLGWVGERQRLHPWPLPPARPQSLHGWIVNTQNAFYQYDRDRSGFLSPDEVFQGLTFAGAPAGGRVGWGAGASCKRKAEGLAWLSLAVSLHTGAGCAACCWALSRPASCCASGVRCWVQRVGR